MEAKAPARIALWKQSSLAPERDHGSCDDLAGENEDGDLDEIEPGVKLMYLTNEGDLDGIKELLDSGTDVNFRDIDDRTALHVAACQGSSDVVKALLENGAQVNPQDRWGSTPLADAIHYNNHDIIKLLEKHGAKHSGTFQIASWRGIKVAVKTFWEGFADEDKVKAFRDELDLLQKIRHPNVVQFLGAVTQSSPMMIVTEYLPKGDLREFLKIRGALKPVTALRFAMDIARGMNYLHENKPEAIIHQDLEPSNILRDDSRHLKVADFGVSKLLKAANRIKEDKPLTFHDTSRRYMAPELFRNEDYDTKVDVFSFALILQEMIEGFQPFYVKPENEVPKLFAAKERPPFRASAKVYAHGLKELIEECWSEKPADRPTFKQIIPRLEAIYNSFSHKRRWKVRPLKCFQNLDWKKDMSNLGSRSRSSRSTGSI
ncbi:serine threonine- kinase HT1-like [Olea europaea subsp. europaea]|uniref:non-specific serine/threonine protein kinase n=1 Tax=Olea europaea subsp. europaea TaxID=158383 RepID=A0A8S0P7K9_OLEEU|nr:serine threonine- kinase HT1-like [Olea europaea subsp. europaea]